MAGRLVLVLAALAPLVVPTVARAGAQWEHPDFATNVSRPQRVLVLPPAADIVRARVNEGLPMVKESAELENQIASHAADALRRLGYDADVETLSPARLAEDRELHGLVRAFWDRVDELIVNVAGEPKGIREGRYTVGETALALGARTGGEGFLLLQSQTVVPSKGQRALASILAVAWGGIPMPPTNQTQLVAILVDGRTGDIASVNLGGAGGPVLKEPEVVARRLATEAFRDYPRRGEVKKLTKRQRKAAARRAPETPSARPAPAGEDEVLERFETVAAASGETAPPRDEGEPVEERREFAIEGEIPPDAAPMTPADVPAPAGPAGPSGASVADARPADVATGMPEPAAAWAAPVASRPEPTRQVIFQMVDGGPAITLRNVAEPAVLVSVDLGAWVRLAAGDSQRVPVTAGSHRILVADSSGRELARASCIVGTDRMAIAEVWPR